MSTQMNEGLDMVVRFHGAVILLESFDREHVRAQVKTKEAHPPREFAVVATYLRTLAHIRTLVALNNGSHFQAASMIARSVFELSVDLRLIDMIDDAPARYDAFSKVERLRVARRIVKFHTEHPEKTSESSTAFEPMEPYWVHEKYIAENAEEIDALAAKWWPKFVEKKRTVPHWSGQHLRDRALLVGAPFSEIYDVNYAELSWYTHPGVGAIATLDKEVYPLVCGKAYGIAIRCYSETLRFMVRELRLADSDPLIEKKLEFARLAAFSESQTQADQLRRELLGF